MRLDGKVALITGAGTGIGAAIAERFVADGARVCITGRRQEMLERVAQSLPAGTVVTCAGDVTNLEDVRRMVDTALGFTGKLDVLVNNAAIDPELWHRVLETNLTGPMYLMKVSIPHMLQGGGGSIVNIASLGGLRCPACQPIAHPRPDSSCSPNRLRWISGRSTSAAMPSARVAPGRPCWKSRSLPWQKRWGPTWTTFSLVSPRWFP